MIWALLPVGLYIFAIFCVSWVSLHPFRTPQFISPGAMGQPHEDVEFISSDGVKLRGWWTEKPGAKVAVLTHGYMMNRCELTPLAVWLAERGYSTLVFDFRAHGKSDGSKSGLGWIERNDVCAACGWVRERLPDANILLVGSSMGSAACALAAAENPHLAQALILDSAYSRLPKAILGWWRFLGGRWLSALLSPTVWVAAPLAGFNPFKVDVAKALQRVHAPILFVHGDRDNLATPDEGKRNLAACAGPSEMLWMQGCGHSEGRWVHPEQFYSKISDFLTNLTLKSPSESV